MAGMLFHYLTNLMFLLCHLNKIGYKEIHKQNVTAFYLNGLLSSPTFLNQGSQLRHIFSRIVFRGLGAKSDFGGCISSHG